jgi:hypothetical protein
LLKQHQPYGNQGDPFGVQEIIYAPFLGFLVYYKQSQSFLHLCTPLKFGQWSLLRAAGQGTGMAVQARCYLNLKYDISQKIQPESQTNWLTFISMGSY